MGGYPVEQEVLHGRQKQLLILLRSQPRVVTSQYLANQLEVSDRTVRNDVQALNGILSRYGARIETIRGKGLMLHMPENEVSPMLHDLLRTPDSLQSREDRANYLLVRLLLSNTGFQLGELEDEMFVSRTTLENDIRFLRKLVTVRRPHLYLNRKDNRISIETSEWNRRLVLTKIFSESWDYHSREGVFLQNTPISSDTLQTVLDLAKNLIRSNNIKMDDYDLIALAFTITVAEFRIRTGHPLDTRLETVEAAEKVAPVVERIMDDIEGTLHTTFDRNERTGILLSMFFRQNPPLVLRTRYDIARLVDGNALHAADLFLQQIKDEYRVDFFHDQQLYVDLAYHVWRLEKRLRYSYERRNSLLPTIKSRYVYFFEMAMTIRESFQNVYGMTLSEDEWGYFADLLITSFNRTADRHFPNGIPVAFLSHLGRSDREMLASQIRSIYSNTIHLLGPFSIYEKEPVMEANPRIILSTVRLETVREELVSIPHLTIPALFSGDVFLRMNELIQECRQSILFRKLPVPMERYFCPQLFFPELDASDEREVITYLTHRIVDLGYATSECVARALDREYLSSTAVGNGIAVPRVRVLGPCRTVIAFAQLRKPILWGNQKVSTVFLPSVSEADLPIFGTLLTNLIGHLCSDRSARRVTQVKSFDDLLELLRG